MDAFMAADVDVLDRGAYRSDQALDEPGLLTGYRHDDPVVVRIGVDIQNVCPGRAVRDRLDNFRTPPL